MLKNYFKSKTKFGTALNIITVLLIIALLIPETRKIVAPVLLRPTRFIHQPRVESVKPTLNPATYNWKLEALNGDVIKLKQFHDQVILINFWATWCPPCIAELPDLQKLYNEYKNDVTFLFVTNEQASKVMDFMVQKSYTIPVYNPRTQYPTDLASNTLPTTFIISKSGEIVVHKTGLAQWNSRKVKNILDILIDQ